MKPTIRNLNRENAEALDLMPGQNVVCISISQPGDPAHLSRRFWSVLRMEFADWDVDRYPDQPNGNGNPSLSRVFTEGDARKIERWATAVRASYPDFIVHCDAGVSRSAAVAEVLLEAFPEYSDAGGMRTPNNYVRRLLRRAFGLVPAGAVLS